MLRIDIEKLNETISNLKTEMQKMNKSFTLAIKHHKTYGEETSVFINLIVVTRKIPDVDRKIIVQRELIRINDNVLSPLLTAIEKLYNPSSAITQKNQDNPDNEVWKKFENNISAIYKIISKINKASATLKTASQKEIDAFYANDFYKQLETQFAELQSLKTIIDTLEVKNLFQNSMQQSSAALDLMTTTLATNYTTTTTTSATFSSHSRKNSSEESLGLDASQNNNSSSSSSSEEKTLAHTSALLNQSFISSMNNSTANSSSQETSKIKMGSIKLNDPTLVSKKSAWVVITEARGSFGSTNEVRAAVLEGLTHLKKCLSSEKNPKDASLHTHYLRIVDQVIASYLSDAAPSLNIIIKNLEKSEKHVIGKTFSSEEMNDFEILQRSQSKRAQAAKKTKKFFLGNDDSTSNRQKEQKGQTYSWKILVKLAKYEAEQTVGSIITATKSLSYNEKND